MFNHQRVSYHSMLYAFCINDMIQCIYVYIHMYMFYLRLVNVGWVSAKTREHQVRECRRENMAVCSCAYSKKPLDFPKPYALMFLVCSGDSMVICVVNECMCSIIMLTIMSVSMEKKQDMLQENNFGRIWRICGNMCLCNIRSVLMLISFENKQLTGRCNIVFWGHSMW